MGSGSFCCRGGKVLWAVGSCKDVKDSAWKDGVVIINLVVGYCFCMNVESLYRVQVRSFFVAMQYLHNFVHGAKGMCCIIKVFSKVVGLVIVSEGGFVLLVSCGFLFLCL